MKHQLKSNALRQYTEIFGNLSANVVNMFKLQYIYNINMSIICSRYILSFIKTWPKL
jgi:hypothetical protein